MLQSKVISGKQKDIFEHTIRSTADKYLDLLVEINAALAMMSLDEVAKIFEFQKPEVETLQLFTEYLGNPEFDFTKVTDKKLKIAKKTDFWEKIKANIDRLADGPKRKPKEPRLPQIDENRVVNRYYSENMPVGENRNVVIGKLQNDVIYEVGILKIDNQGYYNAAKVYFTQKALAKFGHYKERDLQKQLNALLKYGFQGKYGKDKQGLVEIMEGDKLHPSRGGRWHYKVHAPGSIQLVGNIDSHNRYEIVPVFVIDDLVPHPKY
jgi:hypothetical protein